MKTYKCSRCDREATNTLSFRNLGREYSTNTEVSAYAICKEHIGLEDINYYYPSIEEYMLLRAMYEL